MADNNFFGDQTFTMASFVNNNLSYSPGQNMVYERVNVVKKVKPKEAPTPQKVEEKVEPQPVMPAPQKKEKKRKGKGFVIAIVILLIVAVIGVVIYTQLFPKATTEKVGPLTIVSKGKEHHVVDCDTLVTDVVIPDYVTHVDDSAFERNKYLTSVVIGKSVKSIGTRSFYKCESLESLTFHNNVKEIGFWAFGDCFSLAEVTYTGTLEDWCDITFSNSGSNPYSYEATLNIGGTPVTNLVIPASVTTISPYAFYDTESLVSVTIPDSVTTIGEGAFQFCENLKSVNMGNSIATIGNFVFMDCDSLTSLEIPASCISLGREIVTGCDALTSITFLSPGNWYSLHYKVEYAYEKWQAKTDGILTNLTNSSTNAEMFLGGERFDSYWYKK